MIAIKREDYEFLLSSVKFCKGIDNYARLFDLDQSLLSAYKCDTHLLNQLLVHDKFDGRGFEYFIARKLRNMKTMFCYLAELCKYNENYTAPIGRYLGIESDEEELYRFSVN